MMGTLFSQILQLLVQPPGNLVYHLVLVFAVLAGLQAVNLTHTGESRMHARRLVAGFSIILAGQAVLFLSSSLAWQRLIDPQITLPLLDRSIVFLSLALIAWMWNFQQPDRLADSVMVGLAACAILYFIIGLSNWMPQVGSVAFNQTWMDRTWAIALMVLSVTAMVLLLLRRSYRWGLGIGFFLLVSLGVLIHLLWQDPIGDFSGIIRLSMICAFPLLPSIAQARRVEQPLPVTIPAEPSGRDRTTKIQPPDARIVATWLELASVHDPNQIGSALSKAVGQSLVADLTFIVSTPDTISPLHLTCGYDIIREEAIPGAMVDHSHAPLLASAVHRHKSLRLIAESAESPLDLAAVAASLGLKESGHMLFAAFAEDFPQLGGLLVLSPYSKHEWTLEEQTLLETICKEAVTLLNSASGQMELKQEIDRLNYELELTRQALETYQATEAKKNLLDQQPLLFESQTLQDTPLEMAGLLAVQKENQETISRLESENHNLRMALMGTPPEGVTDRDAQHLENELRLTLEEIAYLKNALAEANKRILQLQQTATLSSQPLIKDRESMAKAIQDLRPPVSSILGYTDLLMSESVGILGALQRKFLERIRASSERLKFLLDETLQPSTFSSSPVELAPQPVELDIVLDQAIRDISAILLEKKINLRMNVPKDLPSLFADQDAIQQVFIHLLQNASLATPPQGDIYLQARVEHTEDFESFLLFKITDSGGGIPPEDIPKVFSRQYRSENATIKGVGDTGVGLSIAKTLVEAHGGRIWVDSIRDQSSTFSILLPARPGRNNGNSQRE